MKAGSQTEIFAMPTPPRQPIDPAPFRNGGNLAEYRRKRDFLRTPEPAGDAQPAGGRIYVVQKHAATNLHYDLRLEWNGVLKSWAVPKGPSLNPDVKRLAVAVEDHPVDYAGFEGVIPRGEYGEGTVLVWDWGTWQPAKDDPEGRLRKGHLEFELHGEKLAGMWDLVRMNGGREGDCGRNWLLIKKPDSFARRSAEEVIDLAPDSVKTGRSLEQVADQETQDPNIRRRAARLDRPEPPVAPDLIPADHPEAEPPELDPELPTPIDRPPDGPDWIHEVKYDGYRILGWVSKGRVRLLSRRGNDWSANFPAVAAALARLPVERALLDGEVVARGPDGRISFQNLQNARRPGARATVEYFLFDLLHINGFSTRNLPLTERKRLLETLWNAVRESEPVLRFSESIRGDGPAVYAAACRADLEGIVSKRTGSPYAGGRTKDWLKSKCLQRQEFVVGGFTLSQASATEIGALLLGYYEDGRLVFCGRVGTGFSEGDRKSLRGELEASRIPQTPFAALPREEETGGAVWTEPRMVVEVKFAEWTDDGRLREPAFLGVRTDKPAASVGRESAASTERGDSPYVRILPRSKPAAADPDSAVIGGVAFTHASKALFPRENLTKRDLAEYYLRIAGGFLPEIRRRPLALVRCPDGLDGDCFFQKHGEPSVPESVPRIFLAGGEEKPFLYIESIGDALGLVQSDVLEFHTWGCLIDDPLRPDRLVFDLDPDPALDPAETAAAALDLRAILEEAGLVPFVRTTGGKGLHVVAPVHPDLDWNGVKNFTQRIAERLARADPRRRTTALAKARRGGKVYVDFLRNVRGASAVAAYSTRARPGAPVAAPLFWEEIRAGRSFHAVSTAEAVARLERDGDPWKDLPERKRILPRAGTQERR
jgi:bifunctional non-homologous end joining protein LigD